MEPQGIKAFYMDESGHSGDLAGVGSDLDFRDQPFFVLAGVGIPEASTVLAELEQLKVEHRLPVGELKSKALGSQSKFVADVFDLVAKHELPVFLEVVDKRYYIGTHIVEFLLLSPVLKFGEGPERHYYRNLFAELLYAEAPDAVFTRMVEACMTPSDETLMSLFGSIFRMGFEEAKAPKNASALVSLDIAARNAVAEYGFLREKDSTAHRRFLPPPDQNRHGKPVWMMPNQTCFTNINARINLYRRGSMEGVRFVHDMQLEAASILHDSKVKVEAIKDSGFEPFTPYADYNVKEGATLEFANSHDEPGIQLADVIAGTAMRFYRNWMLSPGKTHPMVRRVMTHLILSSNPFTSHGVNLVGPDKFVPCHDES